MLTHFLFNNQLIPRDNWRTLLWRFSPRYLEMVMNERVYNGKISVTTCAKCPREYVFRNKFPYAVDPDQMAYSILGTNVHSALEDDSIFSELKMDIELDVDMSGILDLVFVHNDELILADYKTWGSYAVAKHVGLESIEVPMLDKDGNPVLYKSSRKGKYEKGEPRLEKVWKRNPDTAENFGILMQLNMYRIMLERLLQSGKIRILSSEGRPLYKVNALRVYCIIRDGNTHVARGRGIFSATDVVNVPIAKDQEVLTYHRTQSRYIKECMDKSEFATAREILRDPPRKGSKEETMNGYICRESCPVAYVCKLCGDHPQDVEVDHPFSKLFDINTGGLYV